MSETVTIHLTNLDGSALCRPNRKPFAVRRYSDGDIEPKFKEATCAECVAEREAERKQKLDLHFHGDGDGSAPELESVGRSETRNARNE